MSETTNLKLFKHDNPETNQNPFDIEKAMNENWDKLDTAYGKLNEDIQGIKEGNTEQDSKIEALEGDNKTNKEDISNIKQEQTTQNESISGLQDKDTELGQQIEQLEKEKAELQGKLTELESEEQNLRQEMNNILPSIVGAGEKVTLNGTAEATMKQFKIYGNSLQETEPSMEAPSTIRHCGDSNINKFDLNTFEKIQDGYITEEKLDNGIRVKSQVAGTGPYWGKFKILDDVSNLVGKTINIRMKFKSTGKNTALALLRLINPEDYNDNYGLDGATKLSTAGTGEIRLSAVIPEDAKTKSILGIVLYANWSGEITKEDCVEYTDIKLVVGEEIKGYSLYNAGTIETVLAHKNLLKPTWAQDLLDRLGVPVSSTDNCITEIDGHRYLKYKANLGWSENETSPLAYFAENCFKENTQYTFKTIMMRDSDSLGSNIRLVHTDGTITAPALFQTANMTPIEYKITSQTNRTVKYIGVAFLSGYTYIDIDNTILYEGTEDELYEDYAQVYNFPTKPGQVFYNEDYLGENGIHQIKNTIILDGQSANCCISMVDAGVYGYALRVPTPDIDMSGQSTEDLYKDILCTHFKPGDGEVYSEALCHGLIRRSSWQTCIYMYLKKSFFEETETNDIKNKFNEYLKKIYDEGNPMKIEYKLAKEKIIPYTPEQQEVWNKIKKIRSYDGVTQVFSTDEISPKFDVEAFSKVQGEHDKLQAQIDAIKALLSTTKTSAMLVDNLEKDLIEEVEEIC